MLDIKYLRENLEEVIKNLNQRGSDFSYLRDVIKLDDEKRNLITEVEKLKKMRNDASKEIGILKREKKMLVVF